MLLPYCHRDPKSKRAHCSIKRFYRVGSSETTREINNNVYFKNLNDKFKFLFLGFAEGDGFFSIYKDKYL